MTNDPLPSLDRLAEFEKMLDAFRDAVLARKEYRGDYTNMILDLNRAITQSRAALRSHVLSLVEDRDKALRFAKRIIDEARDGSVDGWDVQEWATTAGLLVPTRVEEQCAPETCACAEWGDFPQTCYRLAPSLSSLRSQTP